jgi:hypothetical protein
MQLEVFKWVVEHQYGATTQDIMELSRRVRAQVGDVDPPELTHEEWLIQERQRWEQAIRPNEPLCAVGVVGVTRTVAIDTSGEFAGAFHSEDEARATLGPLGVALRYHPEREKYKVMSAWDGVWRKP